MSHSKRHFRNLHKYPSLKTNYWSVPPAKVGQGTRAENRWTAMGGKEKRALEVPPEITTRAIFRSLRHWPGPLDFPPEITRSTVAWLGLRLASQSAEASRNDATMPENQALQSIFGGRIRSSGHKTGRKPSFPIFRSTERRPKLSSAPFPDIAVAGSGDKARPSPFRRGEHAHVGVENPGTTRQQPVQGHGDRFDFDRNGAERDGP